MKYFLYIFLIAVSGGTTLSEGARRMIDPIGHPVMDLLEPPNPGYSDRKYPPFNGRWSEQKLIEFNHHQFLQWKLILNCEEWTDAPRGRNRKQGEFLNLLSGFYPKKDYDETNDRAWTDIQEYALSIYTYFTPEGKICGLDDQGYHMRVVEENRGRRCVTFYGVRGEDALCTNGSYHRGEVIRQAAAGILNGSFIFRESFFGKGDDSRIVADQDPVDVERPAIFPKGRMIRYHQYKATPAEDAGVSCLEVHKGWEAELTASTRKTFYLKGRFGDWNDINQLRLFLPENLLQTKYYLDPYDVAEAEYTDKFGRLTRGLQGWARRCADHYERGSDLGGGRAIKEIRYYDQDGKLSSDHQRKCAIIRFSYPEKGVQQIAYFDEHGRELKQLKKEKKGLLETLDKESSDSYTYYSMLDDDVTVYEADNRDDGEEVKDDED
ncbi:hypothetical protein [uncultured Akkermansia sp.]|jgi:hypothetical protein|uniref:hypothetical protein n=1 Tax=uncultured Akkermansia sp. TaxID=512294 RepID=UPI0025E59F7E|nr:hypothetical protein [uncultured Akkermansia sp.]